MTCEHCREQLTDFIEGDLTAEAEREMREHLAQCAQCAQELVQMRTLVTALRELPEVEPPAELRERLRGITQVSTPGPGGWRRVRYVVATVAAAAAALVMVWTGVTYYGRGGASDTIVEPTVRMVAPVTEKALEARPAGEVAEEVAAAEGEAAEAPPVETTEAVPSEDEVSPRAESSTSHALPEREARERHASAPPRPTEPSRERTPRPSEVREEVAEPAGPPVVPPSEHQGRGGSSGVLLPMRAPIGSAVRADEREARSAAPARSPEQESVGAAGPAGAIAPQGPLSSGPPLEFAEVQADEAGPLPVPEPQYLSVEGSTPASTGTGEGSPFVVSITPPQQRVTGVIVAATITVETENDVARARITVQGSADLELIGLDDDGELFDGPLAAGQKTVLSVHMLARRPGPQSMTMRLRSSDPIVDTRLTVRLGEFVKRIPPAQRLVTFEFLDTPIRAAIGEIVARSGMRVVVGADVGERAVTVSAPDPIPAGEALRAVAEAADCVVHQNEDVFIVEPEEQ